MGGMSGGPNSIKARGAGGGRLPVAPRVRAGMDGEVLPLVYQVERLMGLGRRQVVNVVGGRRSGKSMALTHLREVFGEGMVVRDDVLPTERVEGEGFVVIASEQRHTDATVVLELERWGEDDVIEYLLAVHRERCGSVMKRWRVSWVERLEGVPGFVVPVLEEFVRDEELGDVDEALRRYVRRQVGNEEEYVGCTAQCLGSILDIHTLNTTVKIGHPYVATLLAGEWLASELMARHFRWLTNALPFRLVEKTGELLRKQEGACGILAEALGEAEMQPVVVGLLLATDPKWRPEGIVLENLRGARLCGAQWAGVNLSGVMCEGADLRGADLSNAQMAGANLRKAVCAGARFVGAQLAGMDGYGGKFSECDFSHATLEEAVFIEADLSRARLDRANLFDAHFGDAVLNHASLEEARLREAVLWSTKMEEASFRNADLYGVSVLNVRMRDADFRGAGFCNAKIRYCDLEGLVLRKMDFRGADFTGSYLTGSNLSGSDLGGAILRHTGLAEIQWEDVDLRGVDFTKASFHMGSSRSGMVGSVIASEGTRTGFYTDDYCDQDFKAPEEIRKANLCGCDLRCATVETTDFYLVDLRGARFSAEQGRHFAGCGAIVRGRAE